MKFYYIGIGILIIFAIIFGIIFKTPKTTQTKLKDNPYQDLRTMVFSLTPQALKQEIDDPKQPLCTLMELEISGATATLVSVIDGATSLYLSTGGAIIGGGTHQNVTEVSSVFRKDSKTFLEMMTKDEEHALPQQGHVCFYIVTITGVYKYDGKEADMVSGKDPLSKLFTDGHNVITELRKIAK